MFDIILVISFFSLYFIQERISPNKVMILIIDRKKIKDTQSSKNISSEESKVYLKKLIKSKMNLMKLMIDIVKIYRNIIQLEIYLSK